MLETAAFFGWLAGVTAERLADQAFKSASASSLQKEIHHVVDEWRKALPDELTFHSSVSLFPSHLPQSAFLDQPAIHNLFSSFADKNVPSADMWKLALVESWLLVKKLGEGLQPFFASDLSSIEIHLTQLAVKLSDVCRNHSDFFNKQVLDGIDEIKRAVLKNEAHLQEIRALQADLDNPALPETIASRLITEKLVEFSRFRLLPEFRAVEQALQFSQRVVAGDLRAAQPLLRSEMLGKSVRILSNSTHRDRGIELLSSRGSVPLTDQLSVAIALTSYDYRSLECFKALMSLGSSAAISAAIAQKLNTTSIKNFLDWFEELAPAFEAVEIETKCSILVRCCEEAEWEAADKISKLLTDRDLQSSPLAIYLKGTVMAAMTALELERGALLIGVPFEPDLFTFSDTKAAQSIRLDAADLFNIAYCEFEAAGYQEIALASLQMELWLRLRSEKDTSSSKARIRDLVRDTDMGIHFVDMALRFGCDLTSDEADKIIRRDVARKGELVPHAAIARLSLILLETDANVRANRFATYRSDLSRTLNSNMLLSIEVQILCRAGRVSDAKEALAAAVDVQDDIRSRCLMNISEAEGEDPAARRLEEFERSNNTHDLELLVQALAVKGDPVQLAAYSEKLFERTSVSAYAELCINALSQMGKEAEICDLFEKYSELDALPPRLLQRFAQAQFFTGKVLEARHSVETLRARFDNEDLRHLQLLCLIELGAWGDIPPFAHGEYESRIDRSGHELIRLADTVCKSAPAISRKIVEYVAGRDTDSAEVLAASYFIASSAGWENDPSVSSWLQKAAELSGEGGPIVPTTIDEIVSEQPFWRERQDTVLARLRSGELTIELVGQALNQNLCSMTIAQAVANRSAADPRKRIGIPTFHGRNHSIVKTSFERVLLDPISLLLLADLNLLEEAGKLFGHLLLPHGAMTRLFQCAQHASYHQPSLVKRAQNLITAAGRGTLERVAEVQIADPWLIKEAGVELASLLSEVTRLKSVEAKQVFVVHPGVVSKPTSLGREPAQLKDHRESIIGCQILVQHLRQSGLMQRAEFDRARNFLKVQGDSEVFEACDLSGGAVLMLGGLALSFLLDLELIEPLKASGMRLLIHPQEIENAHNLVRYEGHSSKVVEVIDRAVEFIRDGLVAGRVSFTPALDRKEIEFEPLSCIVAARFVSRATAYLCDDRAINKHGFIGDSHDRRPIVVLPTIIDAMCQQGLIEDCRWFDAKCLLRTGTYLFVPVTPKELLHALQEAEVVSGSIVETAELKTIKDYVRYVCMTDWFQFETESEWLQSLMKGVREALSTVWRIDGPNEVARARSNWLIDLVDSRDWLRFRKFMPDELTKVRVAQILSWANPPFDLSERRTAEYLEWIDEDLLDPCREYEPLIYEQYIERVKRLSSEMIKDLVG